MAEIVSLATALPQHVITLEETKAILPALVEAPTPLAHFRRVADRSRIRQRHLVLPSSAALGLRTIEQRQTEYQRCAIDLAETAGRSALAAAATSPQSIDAIVSVSCTGYMMPSLDVHLSHRLGLSPIARRVPITELGCSAGVAAIGLARDIVRAEGAARAALVVSVEISSLCVQTSEPSTADVMGTLLFGDACVAAVVSGRDEGRGLRILGSKTFLWPDTVSDLGMRLTTTGFRLELSRHVPRLVGRHLRATVEGFLAEHDTSVSDVSFWAIHPGGPKVLETIGERLQLSDAALRASWDVWERCGNVSSATALLILREILDRHRPGAGSLGMVLALGPGMTCEMVLLRAPDRSLPL